MLLNANLFSFKFPVSNSCQGYLLCNIHSLIIIIIIIISSSRNEFSNHYYLHVQRLFAIFLLIYNILRDFIKCANSNRCRCYLHFTDKAPASYYFISTLRLSETKKKGFISKLLNVHFCLKLEDTFAPEKYIISPFTSFSHRD